MSTKYKVILIAFCIFIIEGAAVFAFKALYDAEREKSMRYYENIDALMKQTKLNVDSSMAIAKVLTYNLSEAKELYPKLFAVAKDMGIKARNIEQLQQTQLEINSRFIAQVKDSVINGDSAKIAYYSDKYITYLMEMFYKDSTEGVVTYSNLVELNQVVGKKKKDGFWGFVKKKDLVQVISTDNPYVKLKYNNIIKIK